MEFWKVGNLGFQYWLLIIGSFVCGWDFLRSRVPIGASKGQGSVVHDFEFKNTIVFLNLAERL